MRFFGLLLCGALCTSAASANPPIEAYGKLPAMRAVAISPSADRISFFGTMDNGEQWVNVYDIKSGPLIGGPTGDAKVRSTNFVNDRYVIIRASDTVRFFSSRKFEYTGAFAFDLETGKIAGLLKNNDNLFPAQSGVGWIVGAHPERNAVFMPAYRGSAYSNPSLDLFSTSLKTGHGRVHAKGGTNTRDWIVSDKGVVLAREDWDDKRNAYKVMTKRSGTWELVYETSGKLYPFSLIGSMPDESALVIIDNRSSDNSSVRTLSFDGQISTPIFKRANSDIGKIYYDINRRLWGVGYLGPTPSYEFFDASLSHDVNALINKMRGYAVDVIDISEDMSTLLLHISGGGFSPGYFAYQRGPRTLLRLGDTYREIEDDDVGDLFEIKYKARDGYQIHAIVTTPPGVAPGERALPLIVLPHGGPESHDSLGFDWLAQYFANRGYLVLQPNFRGSSGFGKAHVEAGYGEWGGVMQDDVTDGVNALIKNGWVDTNRVCIVGASYGGYAALAGGAFTPELYQCVAAIAPISDLHLMINNKRRTNDEGENSAASRYLTRFIGDRRKDREKLKEISPVHSAENFQAPVLLVHGVDDTVVYFEQSRRMERALKQAGKPVKLVRLKGEDHWLSTSETRLETLRELAAFVEETIGPN